MLAYCVYMNVCIHVECVWMLQLHGFELAETFTLAGNLGLFQCKSVWCGMVHTLAGFWARALPCLRKYSFFVYCPLQAFSLAWQIGSHGQTVGSKSVVCSPGRLAMWEKLDPLYLWSILQAVSLAWWIGCKGQTADFKQSRSAACLPAEFLGIL